ncbi:20853_t:CDS:2 [Rhizophagus irregularis]|nr:20853_t:CDS:2 [Rhizophagus irregularis]
MSAIYKQVLYILNTNEELGIQCSLKAIHELFLNNPVNID